MIVIFFGYLDLVNTNESNVNSKHKLKRRRRLRILSSDDDEENDGGVLFFNKDTGNTFLHVTFFKFLQKNF